MKTYFDVPFHQKERVKMLGAQFDFSRKQWFCPDGVDLMGFAEWLPADLAKWKEVPKKKRRG